MEAIALAFSFDGSTSFRRRCFQAKEGARNAFFSPDGQTIGFFADWKLKRIPVTGGAAVSLCDAPDDRRWKLVRRWMDRVQSEIR